MSYSLNSLNGRYIYIYIYIGDVKGDTRTLHYGSYGVLGLSRAVSMESCQNSGVCLCAFFCTPTGTLI